MGRRARRAITPVVAILALGSAAPASAAPYVATVTAEPSLAGYWRLDDPLASNVVRATRGTDGQHWQTAQFQASSLLRSDANPAVRFDGASTVTVADAPYLRFTDRFSIEAWIRPEAKPAGDDGYAIVVKSGSYFLHFQRPDHLEVGFFSNGEWKGAEAYLPVLDRLTHLVGTYDGAALRLYANGRPIAVALASGNVDVSSAPLRIGSWSGYDFFNGPIDEPAVYGAALSAEAVREHYEIGADGVAPSAPSDVRATVEDARVELQWSSGGEADLDGYDVYRATSGGTPVKLNASPLKDPAYVDAPVANETAYQYTVRARDRAGNVSAASQTVAATPTASARYRDAVLSHNALQGYWRLGDRQGTTATALRGDAGSYAGGAAVAAGSLLHGDSDAAVDLDGSSGRVSVPDSDRLDVTSAFTLEAWVRADAPASSRRVVLGKRGAYELGTDAAGRWAVSLVTGGGVRTAVASTGPVAGQTYHLAATFDGDALRLHVNGGVVASTTFRGVVDESASTLTVGADESSAHWNGVVDEAAVYDDALSTEAIGEHHEIGTAGSPPAAPAAVTAASSSGQVALDWADSPEPDLAGYHVYRASSPGGTSTRVTGSVVVRSRFVDGTVSDGSDYFYTVKAVDERGKMSAPSVEVAGRPRLPRRYRDTVKSRSSLRGYWRLGDAPDARFAAAEVGPQADYEDVGKTDAPSLLASDADTAAQFSPTKAYLIKNPSPVTVTSGFSAEAWVRKGSLPPDEAVTVLVNGDSFYIVRTNWGTWEVAFWSGGVWKGFEAPDATGSGAHHLALTYDGAALRLYVDGSLAKSVPFTGGVDPANGPLMVGSWWGSGYWRGDIDEAAFYDAPLSAAQIKEHYDVGRDGTAPAAPADLTAVAANGRVDLDWAANGESDLTGYQVFRSTRSGGPFTRISQEPLTASAFTDDDVDNDRAYVYVVRAVDRAYNLSAASAEARATPTAAPILLEPTTVHSNGAELRWTVFDADGRGGDFDRYELHRSTATGFAPNAATRIATITDRTVTEFRDTTAAPNRTFTYKLTTNGTPSGEQTVTLPATGQARKVLQPDARDGQAAYLREGSCANRGSDSALRVGRASGAVRSLLRFDLRDIPAGAAVSSADLGLYLRTPPAESTTISAHRLTAEWREGSGRGDCTGDGATWAHRDGATPWATAGADAVSTASAQVSHAAGDQAGWDHFDVTGAVATWVTAADPNHGLVLTASGSTPNLATYAADDAAEPSLRPKLTVTYADGSQAEAPHAAIAAPAAGERVRGTQTIKAVASDDRRVDAVQFLIDGSVVATDTAEPFEHAWNTTAVANGQRRLAVRATDDAGNSTTSADVTVTVHNSAPPTVTATSPTNRYAQAVLNDSPGGYWRLGEASGTIAGDASGNARNGTLSGTYLLSQPGLLTGDTNTAVRFRNATTDGAVTVAGFSGALGTQVTAEAIVNYSALTTSNAHNRVLARGWGSAGGWMLSVYRDSSNVQRAYWAINKAGTGNVAQAAVTPGTLHLVGTYDGTTMRLYVNGVEAATKALSAAPLTTTANVLVGQTLTSDITIDEAAVYAGAPPAARALKTHADVAAGRPPTVAGTFTAKADAQDDLGIEKVEFFLGDDLVGEDTAAPYAVPVDTLSTPAPIYDGDYKLTARAHDTSGQVVTSSAVDLKVGNAQATKYLADFASTPAPQALTFDDAPGATQDPQPLDVTVTNRSTVAWPAASTVLRSRWIAKDGTSTAAGADVPLSADVAAGGQQTRRVTVSAPALPEGVEQADYTLRIDLVDTAASATFAAKGNRPLEHAVSVTRKARIEPGLERYYHYEGEELGAGMQHLVNLASGNSMVRWTPFAAPGRGLNTVVDLTYNALDDKKKGSPVGNNWSLAISSLTRFGDPLDLHPNKADELAGRAGRYIELTDGDGTTHRFTGRQGADGKVHWDEPAGVHLYLRQYSATDPRRKWALTRPDRVTYFYDSEGFPTEVVDKNGNRLVFTLEAVPNKEDPHGPAKRVVAVTDPAGNDPTPAPNRNFSIAYYSKDDAKKPQIRGKVKRIADRSGSAIDFEYYHDGNLRRIVQRGGTTAGGEHLADRTFVFTYTTSSGSGPAIPLAADRVDPDVKTSNQSSRLYSVRDPLGRETLFTYLGPGAGKDRWKLASRRDRGTATTTYAYDEAARRTTVTAPLDRVSRYGFDGQGKVVSIRNPKDEETTLTWTPQRHVEKVTEPTGAFTQYGYDHNGQLTSATNAEGERTELTYLHKAVDADDADRSISQVETRTEPMGVASPEAGDYQWSFFHDDEGNLERVVDQADHATTLTVYDDGCPKTVTNARQKTTTFAACDANGQPTAVTDANGHTTRFGHDHDGLLAWVQDARHASDTGPDPSEFRTEFFYDSFHRMGRQSTPKSTELERGVLVWSGAEFDANDNVKRAIGPHYGQQWTGAGGLTDYVYDDMDRVTSVAGPDRETVAEGEKVVATYDAAGRVQKVVSPEGVATAADDDYTTFFDYDPLDRVVRERRFDIGSTGTIELVAHRCYDLAGDLRSVTAPKAAVATVDCSAPTRPSHTTTFVYDRAHRLIRSALPGKPERRVTYDDNGNIETTTDELGAETRMRYDERDLLDRVDEPLGVGTGGRRLYTEYEHDAVGNLVKQFSPRSFDAAGQRGSDYVTEYVYDDVDQLVRVDMPDDAQTTRSYVHRAYDEGGSVTLMSLPSEREDPDQLGPDERTTVSYFDTGWVRSSDDPGIPAVHFDYTAEGWQTERVPQDGTRDGRQPMFWSYFADGQLKEFTDLDGEKVTYEYDLDNNLTKAVDGSGATSDGQGAITSLATYDTLDRPVAVTQQRPNAADVVTEFTYDRNGNLASRLENKEPGPGGKPGRLHEFTYDEADWLKVQLDDGGDRDTVADDRKLEVDWFDNGRMQRRTQSRRTAGGTYAVRQLTEQTYFANNLPRSKVTRTSVGGQPIESHDLEYLDASGRFHNGHPLKDTFTLRGPKTSAPCRDTPCTTTYKFDAQERLTHEDRQRGADTLSSVFELDAAGNVSHSTRERRTDRGEIFTEAVNADYDGNRLKRRTVSINGGPATTFHYQHDVRGNLCAIVKDREAAESDCWWSPGSPSGELAASYRWDGLNRLAALHTFEEGLGDKQTTWTHDALDRTVREVETRDEWADARTTQFRYIGLTGLLSEEQQTSRPKDDPGASPQQRFTKTYSYDPSGERIGLEDRRPETSPEPLREYTYGYDPQGSVSLLIDQAGQPRAQYGYTAYGEEDPDLSAETGPGGGLTTDKQRAEDPQNAYRYTAKRFDSGAGDLDMGARRFSPGIGRFLQEDYYPGALENLGLSADPLTANRYSLAGGNPVSFVEVDGHMPCPRIKECGGRKAASQANGAAAESAGRVTVAPASGGFLTPIHRLAATQERSEVPPGKRPQAILTGEGQSRSGCMQSDDVYPGTCHERRYDDNGNLIPHEHCDFFCSTLLMDVASGRGAVRWGIAAGIRGVRRVLGGGARTAAKDGPTLGQRVRGLLMDETGAVGSFSIKGRLKTAQLPTQGRIRYVPPQGYSPSMPLPRGGQGGFIDRFGNEWVRGASRTADEAFEWDVQLSRTGRAQLGWLSRDGSHINISLRGRVTHR